MKVVHLNSSDIGGGAARAAYRIHHALRDADIDSCMWVNKTTVVDWTVEGPSSKLAKGLALIRPHSARPLVKMLNTTNPILHSPAFLPSNWVKRLNSSDADVVHLHWIAGEMLSITDICNIDKPVVWTLHDMWAFCGAEHYTEEFRWREGYHSGNRPEYESGFDLNRWTWARKRQHWKKPMQIVAPSRWLADCVRESALMRGWPVTVIPNCLDTERWRPMEQTLARDLLHLPADVPLLMFGATGGGCDPRKGFDLLTTALEYLGGEVPGVEMVVFGQLAPRTSPDLGYPIHYTGHLHDDLSLRALYSAADALVVPSRQDNLPNIAVEAQACGAPVVAFNTGGLPDIIEHQRTGYLAQPFEAQSLAQGIVWALSQRATGQLRKQARLRSIELFSQISVVDSYRGIYRAAMDQNH